MTTDRQGLARRLRPLKAVMTMTIHHAGHRSPDETAEHFKVAGRETEDIRQLSGCVAELLFVEAAKDCLKSLTPAEVPAAMDSRPLAMRGTTK